MRYLKQYLVVGALVIAPTTQALAQSGGLQTGSDAPLAVSDSVRQLHIVHVSPHLLVLTPATRSATIQLSNQSNQPATANLVLQLGYTTWPETDRTLFSAHWKNGRARDTVIENPTPTDRYAGRWISGVPTTVTLAPHQTQRVTLRINPPTGLPDGEYYARLVAIVAPPTPKSKSKPKDERTVYKLPVTGNGIQPLRDSVRVFYRTGKVNLAVRFSDGQAALDPAKAMAIKGPHADDVWMMFHYEVTGNAHVDGAMQVLYQTPSGAEIPLTVQPGAVMALHGSGTMRWFAQSGVLERGHYKLVVRFVSHQDEFLEPFRLPMTPAELTIPFDVQ